MKKLAPPLSIILKKTRVSPTSPALATSTPINTAELVCPDNDTLTLPRQEELTTDTPSPLSPQIAPVTHPTNTDNETTESPTTLL